jgi:hypothetical protein
MKIPWQKSDNSGVRILMITVSPDELMRLETAAARAGVNVQDFARAKMLAEDLTPRIREMCERTLELDRQFREMAAALGKLANLQEAKE